MQMKTPYVTELHVGFLAPQSKHVLKHGVKEIIRNAYLVCGYCPKLAKDGINIVS
jgi:hypothetical protein